MPGRPSSYAIRPSLSVTARLNFFVITAGSSRIEIYEFGLVSDLLIFFSGSVRLITLPPTFGMYGSGSLNVSP